MKVRKSYIKRIIKEELTKVLLEKSDTIEQALMRIPIRFPSGGLRATLDVSDNSVRGVNFNVYRFDDIVQIAYLASAEAASDLSEEERYIRLVLKLLSSELESQVFLDREPEHIQGRIKSIARNVMRERGLQYGIYVILKNKLDTIGTYNMRDEGEYDALIQGIRLGDEQVRKERDAKERADQDLSRSRS